jgi:hypothetical protein
MNATKQHTHLKDHVTFNGGTKTVCVSTCLSFFGISPDTYNYTSSKSNFEAYLGVIRRNGYAVRSRFSELKIKKYCTMTTLRKGLRKSVYGENDYFIVSGYQQSGVAHLMVLNGKGEFIIDTAPNSKWRIRRIGQVFK